MCACGRYTLFPLNPALCLWNLLASGPWPPAHGKRGPKAHGLARNLLSSVGLAAIELTKASFPCTARGRITLLIALQEACPLTCCARAAQESEEAGSKSLLLSSSRQEVKLWDVSTLESGSLVTWEDCRGGHFNHAGTRAAAVGYPIRCAHAPRAWLGF